MKLRAKVKKKRHLPAKKRRAAQKSYFRSRLKKYGLSESDFLRLLYIKQKNRCAICFNPVTKSTAHVDHDHNTGRIRGLLCRRCNTAMGMFSDEPLLLIAAARYLEGLPTRLSD